MLEDITIMEKKPNGRSNQVPVKAGTEGKKNTDTLPFGKYNRRREPNNGKYEVNRKPNNSVKQGKFSDKRPKPRGQYYGGGNQESKVDDLDFDPEYGSQFAYGRKKQNLNHLLNFTLTPRPVVATGGSSFHNREKSGNWLATHKHKYNKEQFLQANCQFVVKAGFDYTLHMIDPDTLVDWTNIEQIRLRTTELMVCPICLDVPIAGKMTRCGHVYCWPCILHYLALSDKSWRKCPICYESIHRTDLKSVIFVENQECRVGDEFTFRLMKRDRGTLLPVPVAEDDVARDKTKPMAVSEPLLTTVYSKLLLASSMDVDAVLHGERIELEDALKAAQGEPEVCFIEQALELLMEREQKKPGEGLRESLKNEETAATIEEGMSSCGGASEEVIPVVEDPFGDVPSEKDDADSDEGLPNVSPEDVETENQVTGQKPFYFYQALDGQNVYLNALNLRMLETQYGGLANAPLTITGPVLEKESGSMTRELRNRLRSLSHLPITAAFELLELNLGSLVGPEVLEAFAEPLYLRAEKRRRRERDERRRERRITQESGLGGWGQRRAPRIRLDSEKHFPRCGEEESVMPGPSNAPPSTTTSRTNSMSSVSSIPDIDEVRLAAHSPLPEPVAKPTGDYAGPSFAQMLKAGAISNRPRKSAWGREAAASSATTNLATGDDEDYCGVPRYQASFSDVIALALEKADLNAEDGGSWKKKKKKKRKNCFLERYGIFHEIIRA